MNRGDAPLTHPGDVLRLRLACLFDPLHGPKSTTAISNRALSPELAFGFDFRLDV